MEGVLCSSPSMFKHTLLFWKHGEDATVLSYITIFLHALGLLEKICASQWTSLGFLDLSFRKVRGWWRTQQLGHHVWTQRWHAWMELTRILSLHTHPQSFFFEPQQHCDWISTLEMFLVIVCHTLVILVGFSFQIVFFLFIFWHTGIFYMQWHISVLGSEY